MELEESSFLIGGGENESTDSNSSSLSGQQQAHQSSRDDDEDGGKREDNEVMVSEEKSSEPGRSRWRRAGEGSNEDGLDDREDDETCRKDEIEGLDSFGEGILKGREKAWEGRRAEAVSRVDGPRRRRKLAHHSF